MVLDVPKEADLEALRTQPGRRSGGRTNVIALALLARRRGASRGMQSNVCSAPAARALEEQVLARIDREGQWR